MVEAVHDVAELACATCSGDTVVAAGVAADTRAVERVTHGTHAGL
jgi:hypothetical protein